MSQPLKTAVVTGASSGIGKALVEDLLKKGNWRVCLVARSADKMNAIASEHKKELSHVVTADLSDAKQCTAACESIKTWLGDSGLNLLVNNAGASPMGKGTAETSVEEWNQIMNVNLTSAFVMTKQLVPSLEKASSDEKGDSDGSIVNISSLAAVAVFPTMLAYSVAKAGMTHLTKLNALEFSAKRVRVNAILPAWVRTGFLKAAGVQEAQMPMFEAVMKKAHPIGRPGLPSDVIALINFLACKKSAGWMTGACIPLDGGSWLGDVQE